MSTSLKRLITVLSLSSLLLSGSAIAMRLTVYGEGRTEYRRLQDRILPEVLITLPENSQKGYKVTGQPMDQLSSLSAQNPDYVCWLLIPGTRISYPVVAETVPGYYLNHTFSGRENPCGTVFTLDGKPEWPWKNLVLYGHNMKDGSMFAGLKRYREESYWREHSRLWLYLNGKRLEFAVFSCTVTDEGGEISDQKRFEGNEERAEAPIVTLSTCYGKGRRAIYASFIRPSEST